jgi:D-alanyl-D-alanine carboxypeptidase
MAFEDGVKIRNCGHWARKRPRGWRPLALALALAMAAPSTGALARPKARAGGSAIAAAIVLDMNSGRPLYEQSPDVPRVPASLTKMMTLYVLFTYMRAGAASPNSELVVTPYAASQAPTKLNLKPGATIRAADAVNALVTLSDAAVTIAENLAGTEQNFARVMTQKAQSIGMMSTQFRNASGLPIDGQVTSARDIAILAQHLIRDFPEYYGCFQTKYFTYNGRRYRNHNHLLFGYKGTDGIKTGYTRLAGFNLTASVRRDNKHLVAVVLGGRTGAERDAAMRSLLEQNFPKAVAGKPLNQTPLVASLEAPPAPPAPPAAKKQVFALASAAPAAAPVNLAQDSAPESPEKLAPAPAPAQPVATSATPVNSGKTGASAGPYDVQVGAYASQAEAEARLGEVQGHATTLLDGHQPFAVAFQKDETQWFRARFAGFSQDDAKSACVELKRMSFDCVVMRAN